MNYYWYIFILIFSLLASLIGGCLLGQIIQIIKKENLSKKFRREAAGISGFDNENNFLSTGMAEKTLNYMVRTAVSISHINEQLWITKRFVKSDTLSNKNYLLSIKCMMPEIFGNYALREVQFRFSFISIVAGALIGLFFSYALMFILAFIGFFIGYYIPIWAMKKEKSLRCENLDKCLPEMLEVVSLGLRSGLTFDRSLKIYTSHFKNEFASSCLNSQRKWESGILTREEALRNLAKGYDSSLLVRIIENIIRSLRFGSSLVEGLEEAALESRNLYKAKQEEIISKAPVKMMIPTGTLILPAMLILVLGPILLELGNGF